MDKNTKICRTCKLTFKRPSVISKGVWEKRSFCSRKCVRHPGKFQKGMTPWNKGKEMPFKGNKHYEWKETGAKYMTIHDWIRSIKKRPDACEFCGVENKRFEWSNIDHRYSRNTNDYINLCCSCHRKHDYKLRKNGQSVKYTKI